MSITVTTPNRVPVYSPASRMRGACGDRLKIEPVATDRIYTCPHRPAAGQGQCGMRQYLVRVWILGEPWVMAVEITYQQMRHMERVEMTTGERMVYLGLTAPGVDRDIERAS